MRTDDPRPHKRCVRSVSGFDSTVWDTQCEGIVLTVKYVKCPHGPNMLSHLLATGDRPLAEANPYDALWGIGLRADHAAAQHPPPWRGHDFLGNFLQHVCRLFRGSISPSFQTSIPRQRQCACSSLQAMDTGDIKKYIRGRKPLRRCSFHEPTRAARLRMWVIITRYMFQDSNTSNTSNTSRQTYSPLAVSSLRPLDTGVN